ncbi:hypothetical protein BC938DRAFT_473801 [Jimgerdemannia flammicorona]|uniref:FG-GAP repeat protein n=1 Tax=Jimgerdemannia flammicorona TaxID=994334 RepID=A0A433Q3H7_9FUNG|nr:hypothetical protein BC938DRAFT_473801 [Jimgerdemannia flammicorona]
MGLADGFIAELAALDLHGDYAAAHDTADTGGDFTLRHAVTFAYFSASWRVPVKDLVKIYERVYAQGGGVPPPANAVQSCMVAAFAAAQVDGRLGQYLFAYYGAKSPFLVREIEGYYLGGELARWLEFGLSRLICFDYVSVILNFYLISPSGINDMSAQVSLCWHPLADWFERGPETGNLCSAFMDLSVRWKVPTPVSERRRYVMEHASDVLKEMGLEVVSHVRGLDGVVEIEIVEVEHGVELKAVEKYLDWIHERYPALDLNDANDSINDDGDDTPGPTLVTQTSTTLFNPLKFFCRPAKLLPTTAKSLILTLPYATASLGYALASGDFDGDGIPELAISAPYYTTSPASPHSGAVFVVPTSDIPHLPNNILAAASVVLAPASAQARFGWSIAVADLNKDGMDDLVVAAPFAEVGRGAVYVFFGRKGAGLRETPDVVLELAKEAGMVNGFGMIVVGTDVDGDGFKDVLIACPMCDGGSWARQTGTIHFLLSTYNHTSSSRTPLRLNRADHILRNPSLRPLEHFGSAIEILEHPDRGRLLLVGAPGYSTQKAQGVGRVYGFQLRPDQEGELKKVFDLSGTEEFQGFGSQITMGQFLPDGRPLMAVASPSEEAQSPVLNFKSWQAGVVRIIDVSHLTIGATLADDALRPGAGLVAAVNGSAAAAHLGQALARSGNGKPGLWIGEPLAEGERGRVYRWELGKEAPSDTPLQVDTVAECYRGDENMARFGSRIWSGDLNGDGREDLVVTSEHSGLGARLGGSVRVTLG